MKKQGKRPGSIASRHGKRHRASLKYRKPDKSDITMSKMFDTYQEADDWLWQKGEELGLIKNAWNLDGTTIEVQVGSRVAYFDADDWEVLRRHTWTLDTPVAGYTPYLTTRIKGKKIRVHSLIVPQFPIVDHIDRNGLNNRKSNLRDGSNGVNQRNQKMRSDNTTGVRGVCRLGTRWRAEWVDANGKRHSKSFYGDGARSKAIAYRHLYSAQ